MNMKAIIDKHGLQTRAMLATLTVRQWTARKLDKKATQKANKLHNASRDAGNYNKALIAPEALKEIQSTVTAARAEHYRLTLPWRDNGSRILSSAAYPEYAQIMMEHKDAFYRTVNRFIADYPALRDAAEQRLGDMFKADEYPVADQIRGRFEFASAIDAVPVADDFRAALPEEVAERIRSDIEQRSTDAVARAQGDVWSRIAELAERMDTQLSNYAPGTEKPGKLHDSLVTNVRDLIKLLPSLDITNDPRIREIADELDLKLCSFDPRTLREDEGARSLTAQRAREVLAKVRSWQA